MSEIQLTVNRQPTILDAPPMKRLLDVLREDLHLTGAKEAAAKASAAPAPSIMNGELVNSCLVPILQAQGAEITTIEGLTLADSDKVHPIQQCFLQHGGAQCGICTPGMILATHHLLAKHPHPTLPEIQEGLAGNLCRCTGYMRIFEAVQQAANQAAEHQEVVTPIRRRHPELVSSRESPSLPLPLFLLVILSFRLSF